MKTLGQLGYVQDTDLVKFPHGAIQDKTDLLPGTPVTRGLYNDILQNIYKLLDITGTIPNDNEDSENSQHQIIDALKKFSNELNDLQQVVTLNTLDWNVNFDIDLLPDNYVFIGKVSDNYVSGSAYTFSGNGTNSYTMSSNSGFKASDLVLITIDQSNVKFLNLSAITQDDKLLVPFGTPLSYNEGNTVRYLSDGSIITDLPSIDDIQQSIRVDESNVNLDLVDAIIFKGFVLCLVLDTSTVTYSMFSFNLNNLVDSIPVSFNGFSFPVGVDNQPYMYCDGTNIFLTNNSGNSTNDYDFHKLDIDSGNDITLVSSFSIDNTFKKTTNAFITGDFLFTFIGGLLEKYELSTGIKTNVGAFNTINGVVFKQNGNTYYSNGEVAVKWEL